MRGGKALKIVLLLIVLALSFMQIYRIHSDYTGVAKDAHPELKLINVTHYKYPYPLHADEWVHLARGLYMLDEKSIGFVNPYVKGNPFANDYELGYHAFLAGFFGITQLNPVFTYQYLPAIFFVINSIFLFLLVKRLTSNYYISLFSIIFFLAVPSNINILGNWFATPLTFSLFMIFWFFTVVDRFAKEKKKRTLILAIFLFLISIIVYPFATVIMSLILPFYLIFELKIHKTAFLRKNKWMILAISLVIIAAFFITLFSIKEFGEFMTFTESWTPFHINYPLYFYGLIPLFFAVMGFIAVFINKMNKLFIIWPLVCIAGILIENITGNSYFIAYERLVYYYMVGLAPLAAIGLHVLIDRIYSSFKQIKILSAIKYLSSALIILMFLTLIFFMFKDCQKVESGVSSLYLIGDKEYEAVKFVGDNYGKDKVILADPYMSVSIYPISKDKIVAMYSSNLAAGNPNDYKTFLEADCSIKKQMSERVQFIITNKKLECDFLKEIFNNGDYVYEVAG